MRTAISIISNFGKFAGTILNKSMCEGLWIGSFKDRQANCTLFDMKWPTEPIRCLGLHIGHDKA